MKISELTKDELFNAKIDIGMGFWHPTFSDGWESALTLAAQIEECHCRCHACKKPLLYPWNEMSQKPMQPFIKVYGGDICGEYNFCKECWSKLSDD